MKTVMLFICVITVSSAMQCIPWLVAPNPDSIKLVDCNLTKPYCYGIVKMPYMLLGTRDTVYYPWFCVQYNKMNPTHCISQANEYIATMTVVYNFECIMSNSAPLAITNIILTYKPH